MLITSLDNDRIKGYIKLKDRKYRKKTNTFIVEGRHLVLEAYKAGKIIELILEKDEVLPLDLPIVYVTNEIISRISEMETPSTVMALCKMDCEEEIKGEKILMLDGIQDPGNLGTILRTVDSVGLKQLIVSKGTADAYNPKVVRSTMGAIFRVKVIEVENLKETIEIIRKNNYNLLVTSLQTNDSVYDMDYYKKVIVIGNEANGVSKEIQDIADNRIKIPMLGKTESLNASVATGVILYEYVRQKISK